ERECIGIQVLQVSEGAACLVYPMLEVDEIRPASGLRNANGKSGPTAPDARHIPTAQNIAPPPRPGERSRGLIEPIDRCVVRDVARRQASLDPHVIEVFA